MHSQVSIITPNFNKAQYIEATIQSVINQDYEFWELIIVDDNSTDNSWERANSYPFKDQRIKLIQRRNGNKGASACRNDGLSIAKGEFIIFLDSDDFLSPFCLSQRIQCIEELNLNLDFAVFPSGCFFNEIGDTDCQRKIKSTQNHLKQFLSYEIPWNISAVIWSKSFLKNILGGFDVSYQRLQDVELHTRALISKAKYKVFDQAKVDFFYRIDPDRATIPYSSPKFNEQFLNSAFYFILEMDRLLSLPKSKSIGGSRKYLRGFYLEALFHNYRTRLLNKNGSVSSCIRLHKDVGAKMFKEKKVFLFVYIYSILCHYGFCRIRGFHALLKFMITHI